MRALVEVLDQPALHGDADQQHHRNGEDDRQRHRILDDEAAPLAEPGLGQRRLDLERGAPGRQLVGVDGDRLERDQLAEGNRAEGAEHEQRTMREVDDTERAEHEGQPQRDQRVGAPLVEAVEKLGEQGFHQSLHAPSGAKGGHPDTGWAHRKRMRGRSSRCRAGLRHMRRPLAGPFVSRGNERPGRGAGGQREKRPPGFEISTSTISTWPGYRGPVRRRRSPGRRSRHPWRRRPPPAAGRTDWPVPACPARHTRP